MSHPIELTVYGVPAGKGSKKAFVVPGKNGGRPRAVVVDDNKASLKTWEAAIRTEAQRVMAQLTTDGRLTFQGAALAVVVLFLLPRPASISAKHRPMPTVKPDIDKLARAALDPLTQVLYNDDAQICHLSVEKRYAEGGQVPGCRIVVSELTIPLQIPSTKF